MQHYKFTSLLLPLISLFSPEPVAYEPVQHRLISALSVELFNRCLSPDQASFKITPQEKLTIADADAGEDTWLSKMPARVFNWHFYNADKENQQLYWPIHRSMTRLLINIEAKIADTRGFDATLAGSALHFIEDVTVPAHVAPVFHGPLPPLLLSGPTGLRGARLIHDAIDTFPIDREKLKNTIHLLSSKKPWCESIFSPDFFSQGHTGRSYARFLPETAKVRYFVDVTAEKTLNALTIKIPECRRTWGTFWNHDYGNDYFSGYRHEWDQDHPLPFGKEGLLAGGCRMTKQKYADFVYERHLQAIKSGAGFLAFYRFFEENPEDESDEEEE